MNFWMRRWRAALPWLVVAVLSSGTVSLVLLPAAWITPQFTKASGGHVNLVDPAGSLWHGSATLMLAAGFTALNVNEEESQSHSAAPDPVDCDPPLHHKV